MIVLLPGSASRRAQCARKRLLLLAVRERVRLAPLSTKGRFEGSDMRLQPLDIHLDGVKTPFKAAYLAQELARLIVSAMGTQPAERPSERTAPSKDGAQDCRQTGERSEIGEELLHRPHRLQETPLNYLCCPRQARNDLARLRTTERLPFVLASALLIAFSSQGHADFMDHRACAIVERHNRLLLAIGAGPLGPADDATALPSAICRRRSRGHLPDPLARPERIIPEGSVQILHRAPPSGRQ